MDGRRGNPARLLAPIALVAFALAFIIVVASSGTSNDSDGNGGRVSRQQDTSTTTTTVGDDTPIEPRVDATFYTVKTGDTLGGIAETVGVPIPRLQELNPELDPQALVSGQKIRLRE